MDWSDLTFFLALARSGSLSAAAKRMGTDHSTVARRIESLERDLGIRLVDRLPRAYQLTNAGERVRDLGGAAETAIADIERYARGADRSPHGVVRISGPPHLISSLIAPSLTSLRRSNPDLRIELAGEPRAVSLSRGRPTLRYACSALARRDSSHGGSRSSISGSMEHVSTSRELPRATAITSATTRAWSMFHNSAGLRPWPAPAVRVRTMLPHARAVAAAWSCRLVARDGPLLLGARASQDARTASQTGALASSSIAIRSLCGARRHRSHRESRQAPHSRANRIGGSHRSTLTPAFQGDARPDDRVDPYGPPVAPVIRYRNQEE